VKELAGDGVPVAVTCRVRRLARQPYYGHDPDTPETHHGMILGAWAGPPVTRSAQRRWW